MVCILCPNFVVNVFLKDLLYLRELVSVVCSLMGLEGGSEGFFDEKDFGGHGSLSLDFDGSFDVLLEGDEVFSAFSEEELVAVFDPVGFNDEDGFLFFEGFDDG
jgi:hypothetical protein